MPRLPLILTLALSFASARLARADDGRTSHRHHEMHDDDDGDDCDHDDDLEADEDAPVHRSQFAWAVVREDGNSMSGSLQDLKAALRAGKKIETPYLWVRSGEETYLISDEKVLDRLEELEEPQRVLAAKQTKLGKKQAELGRQQARLGAAQARAAHEMARRALDGDDSRSQARTEVREIAEQQRESGQAQGQLGREQGQLGREQGRLGRRLEEQVHELFEDARKSGAARRID